MTTNKKSLNYTIRYDGADIPGMTNTVATCLYENGFAVDNISITSGGTIQSTFIICHKESYTQNSNSKSDRILLEDQLNERLNILCEQQDKASGQRIKSVIKVSVDEMRENDDSSNTLYNIYIDIDFKDAIGVFAWISFLLRPFFSIDNVVDRPVISLPGIEEESLLERDLIRVSPRLECKPINSNHPAKWEALTDWEHQQLVLNMKRLIDRYILLGSEPKHLDSETRNKVKAFVQQVQLNLEESASGDQLSDNLLDKFITERLDESDAKKVEQFLASESGVIINGMLQKLFNYFSSLHLDLYNDLQSKNSMERSKQTTERFMGALANFVYFRLMALSKIYESVKVTQIIFEQYRSPEHRVGFRIIDGKLSIINHL